MFYKSSLLAKTTLNSASLIKPCFIAGSNEAMKVNTEEMEKVHCQPGCI